MSGMWTYVEVVISPATTAMPVVTSVSQATRAAGSLAMIASRTASGIWSPILSGCPSVPDSGVERRGGRCNRQRLEAEPDQQERRQRLRGHLATHTRGLACSARRVRHDLEEPQHAGIVRREALSEPRVTAVHGQRVLREVVRADGEKVRLRR